ncbi:troponin I, fast skeletal muscle isoform X1 [Oncorhynchus kisutch]|uniref:troponin I, fast skeletal muscle isoform X1 n=1 Tax=Oncorhynchus kisutch TaxID=8019 RepID=UPI0009A07299|nr:troponin I, fast skeletal muscle isoform X1 [Oncorhynchus kisutch]
MTGFQQLYQLSRSGLALLFLFGNSSISCTHPFGKKQESKMSEKKMSSSRKHHLKSVMLQIAKDLLEAEAIEAVEEKKRYMDESCPALDLPGSLVELQEMCKTIHHQLDKVDEERYDLAGKVGKCDKEIDDLRIKVVEIQGIKKPALKKVRMSADAMLQALLGSKHKVTMDLRSNLKQVKKEVKEDDKDTVGDWRKNIDDKAGMDGRKKMFEAA